MRPVLHQGDAASVLKTLPAECVQCCVTSPPYFGLRDYGVDGQLGLEATPEAFVAGMVRVFQEVKRVLRDDGTLWLNIGDSYAASARGGNPRHSAHDKQASNQGSKASGRTKAPDGYKPKDLLGIPWMLAFALRADGWYLRSDIIWSKPNPMPESVMDRPTRAHEYLFLFTKQPRYYYDAAAIRTPLAEKTYSTFGTKHRAQGNDPLGGVKSDNWGRSVKTRQPKDWSKPPHGSSEARRLRANPEAKTTPTDERNGIRPIDKQRGHSRRHAGFNDRWDAMPKEQQAVYGANARSVWTIAPKPYKGAHFATFPPELAQRCIKAGSRLGDTVLDPFGGSGTTAAVATKLGRNSIYIDLNPAYMELANERLAPIIAQEEILESLI